MMARRIVSGVQPSGRLHLGNWLGAIRQIVQLQGQDQIFFFIADLHALSSVREGAQLAASTQQMAMELLALGVDPQRTTFFVQSAVPEHLALAWALGSICPVALLERAHSYKDKLARGVPAQVGLFTYPVLQAADILLYGAQAVPVGPDQRQHIEMARDLAGKFNLAFVPGYRPTDPHGTAGGARGILRPPELMLRQAEALPGTDGQKMSKSYHNTLPLFAPAQELKKKVMGMVTDATGVAQAKPERGPLFELLRQLCPPPVWAEVLASWRAGGRGYGDYKKQLLQLLMESMAQARAAYADWARRPDEVRTILQEGAARARLAAQPVWQAVAQARGLQPHWAA